MLESTARKNARNDKALRTLRIFILAMNEAWAPYPAREHEHEHEIALLTRVATRHQALDVKRRDEPGQRRQEK